MGALQVGMVAVPVVRAENDGAVDIYPRIADRESPAEPEDRVSLRGALQWLLARATEERVGDPVRVSPLFAVRRVEEGRREAEEAERVRDLAERFDGVDPKLANFESGVYRFAKHLYFIVPRASSTEAQQFMEFLRSARGVKALRETETLPDAE